ncbi:glycosyltransferase family 4 protein [bacterium]|nr:glycosyltransferase family 4 protein [bacterium]
MTEKKILHVCTVGITARTFLLPIFKKLQNEGFDVTFACTDDEDARFVESQGIPFFPVKISRNISITDFFAIFKLYKFIKKNNFVLVNTHTAKAGFAGRTAAWLARVPIIIHTAHGLVVHEYLSSLKKNIYTFLERWIGAKTSAFIVVTDKVGDELIKAGIAKKNKIHRIYNGINLDDFSKINESSHLEFLEKLNINNDDVILGTLSRLVPDKGLEDLIQAFALIHISNPEIKLIIAGDGPLRNKLANLTEKLQIKDNVNFIGWQDDVTQTLALFDVFCLPTLREGFGYVFLEAQAAGVPVIATKISPLTETMQDGESALLVPPNSPEELSSAMQKTINDTALRNRLIENGFRNVKERFDQRNQLDEIVELYNLLLTPADGGVIS